MMRIKNDPIYNLKIQIRKRISYSFTNKEFKKPLKSEAILGCDYMFFKKYIEDKFIEGMTWENYGNWYLDHIKPISWAKTKEEVLEYNHYTNFQPLWQKDNLSKGNICEG